MAAQRPWQGPGDRWGPGRSAAPWRRSGARPGRWARSAGPPRPPASHGSPPPAFSRVPPPPPPPRRGLAGTSVCFSPRLSLSPIQPPAARASSLASGHHFRDPRPMGPACGRRPGDGGAAPRPVPQAPGVSCRPISSPAALRGPQKRRRSPASRRAEGSPAGAGVFFLSCFSSLPFFLFFFF